MALGMSYDDYWNGDVKMVKYYREANKIQNDMKNHEFWLQGYYIYQSLINASPVFNPFADRNTKPIPYFDRPIAITKEQQEEQRKEREREQFEENLSRMQEIMVANNQKLKEQQEKLKEQHTDEETDLETDTQVSGTVDTTEIIINNEVVEMDKILTFPTNQEIQQSDTD